MKTVLGVVLAVSMLGTLFVAPVALATPDPPSQAQPEALAPPRPMTRDPFRPFMLDLQPHGQQLTPLQRYDLGQLTVVGTLWNANPPRALLQDSDGMGYIVTLGTPIGPNGGAVTAIGPDRIVVEEHVLDFYGKEQVKKSVLAIPKEEGPNQPARE